MKPEQTIALVKKYMANKSDVSLAELADYRLQSAKHHKATGAEVFGAGTGIDADPLPGTTPVQLKAYALAYYAAQAADYSEYHLREGNSVHVNTLGNIQFFIDRYETVITEA